ncbi:outer membrane lipoprotein-sorting protein [Aliifodinibius sp. S!AR15-10]|uniref:outer membrane lipoprotein-sorting protein n=1 Tax=Aliifodinibius sp. S!AR15-10 TaxID=2950437 RepID=UPI002862EC9C|nr:outer membrane lipoprotein-sorting protein [Aliifodinibius sp. S!AR15-10]MDR8391465.1 outer membrane lipoprotein-sorting protein [Aliifodinibius sp. S!AR15-10]
MKLFKYILSLNLLLIVFITLPAVGQSPDQILAKIDSVQNAFSDMSATEQMKLIDEENRVKKRVVEIKQKGKELRMVRFREPADVRGVGFLRLDSDRLYLYLPAFRKVRRIASLATNENFMGTDFTYEDMSQSVYADDYTARELSTQQGQYRLFLEPKPSADVNYHHLVILADTSNYVLRKVEFYDREEEKIKELTIDNIEKIDGYWMGKTMRMVSLDENHKTVLELSDIQFDQGLSDSEFSDRSLKRPIR